MKWSPVHRKHLDLLFMYNFYTHAQNITYHYHTAITHHVSVMCSIFTSLTIFPRLFIHTVVMPEIFSVFIHFPLIVDIILQTAFHSCKFLYERIFTTKKFTSSTEESQSLLACANSEHSHRISLSVHSVCYTYDNRNEQKLHQRMWN